MSLPSSRPFDWLYPDQVPRKGRFDYRALWTVGMAIGVLFDLQPLPGFNVELTNFLIGNLLWVTPERSLDSAALNVIALILIVPLHKKLLALCFDEEASHIARGGGSASLHDVC